MKELSLFCTPKQIRVSRSEGVTGYNTLIINAKNHELIVQGDRQELREMVEVLAHLLTMAIKTDLH